MIGSTKLKQITDYILKKSRASETEVLIFSDNNSLTRFANNQIHQNVSSQNLVVQVRSVVGKKQGVVSTNLTNPSHLTNLSNLTNQAHQIALLSPEDPHFSHLPGKKEGKFSYKEANAYKDSTAQASPQYRSGQVAKIIKMAKDKKLTAFGSLSSQVSEIVVANSHGVFAYHPSTQALLNIRIMREETSGYAGEINLDIEKLNLEEAARRAIDKVFQLHPRGDFPFTPQEDYEVILEEPAVAEMMSFLSYLAFGARAFHEERSFISGNLGKQVLGENMTIWDDPLNTEHLPLPFDFQGLPKQKVVLIEKGIAKNILYDHYLGQKHQAQPTGHGLPAPSTEDAYALHLHLKPGSTPKKQLLKGIKKGILVSRFWYVRSVHPKELTITGMTRDGTFLIKKGEIVSGLPNLRFTVSIPRVLSLVSHISGETHLEPSDEGLGASLVPAIRVKEFKFTGVSKL